MSLVFPRNVAGFIQAGKITATVVTRQNKLEPGVVRPLKRRYERMDAEGEGIGEFITEVVRIPGRDGGEARPIVLTIKEIIDLHYEELRLEHALPCGFRTVQGLRAAWVVAHPRTPEARFVRFELGDTRDRPRFLSHTQSFRAGVSGDYTTVRSRAADEAEVLSPTEYDQMSASNRQKEIARARAASARLAQETAEQRAARVAALAQEMGLKVSELVIMEQRTRRIENRLNRSEGAA